MKVGQSVLKSGVYKCVRFNSTELKSTGDHQLPTKFDEGRANHFVVIEQTSLPLKKGK